MGALGASSTASAISSDVNVEVVNGIAIRLLDKTATNPITNLAFSFSATPSGTFASDSFNVEVDTSNLTGYKLYMQSNYEDPATTTAQNPVYTTNLVNITNENYTIPTFSSSHSYPSGTAISKTDFSSGSTSGTSDKAYVNRWGYSLDDTSYYAIPAHSTTDQIGSSSTPVAHERTPVYIAMNVDLSRASGTYKNQLVFSAIANPIPTNYTLSFNLDGGSAPTSSPDAFDDMTASEVAASHTFTIPNVEPVKTANLFVGWLDQDIEDQVDAGTLPAGTKGSSTNPYLPGDTITIVGDEYYTGQATLTAIWNSNNFWTITTMQEMTPDICNSVYTPNNGTGSNITLVDNAYDYYTTYGVNANGTRYVPQRTLYDIRGADGTGTTTNPVTSGANVKSYTIRKLADGNCWMTEDLKLGGDAAVTLSANETNIVSDYVLPTQNTGTWCQTNSADCDNQNLWIKSGVPNGYLYNWHTATAGTGTYSVSSSNASGSLCPKGWRLPNGDTSNDSFYYLAQQYGWNGSAGGGNTIIRDKFLASPLNFNYTGYRYANTTEYTTFSARYWSRTVYSESHAYDMLFYNGSGGGFYVPYNSNRWYGSVVRCLAIR